jgi:hypothetical protein
MAKRPELIGPRHSGEPVGARPAGFHCTSRNQETAALVYRNAGNLRGPYAVVKGVDSKVLPRGRRRSTILSLGCQDLAPWQYSDNAF